MKTDLSRSIEPLSSATLRTPPSPFLGLEMLALRHVFSKSLEHGMELLRQYYAKYEEAFPDPTERTSFERLSHRMQDPESPLEVACFLHGDTVVGGRHFKILTHEGLSFAYGEFTWVSRDSRGNNLGSQIRSTTEDYIISRGAKFLLGDFHDPLLVSPETREQDLASGISPEGRLEFWKKQGYLQLDCPYILPPLFGQTEWVKHCKLGIKTLDGNEIVSISKGDLLGMLCKYWDTFGVTYRDSQEFSDFVSSFEGIDAIKTLPLSDKRSFIG